MGMPQPAFYLLKCEMSSPPGFPKPSCVNDSNRDLFNYLAQKLMEYGIIGTAQPVRTGCLNRCNMGPVMLVEPGHHMYIGLNREKIDKIVESHIVNGEPVKEYLIPVEVWDEPIKPMDMMKASGRL